MPQALNLFVNHRLLLDVSVSCRQVRFRLVEVVVGDEIMHGVLGEELPVLLGELGRQGLVVRDNQGRLADFVDDVGYGKGLARASHAKQGLMSQPLLNPIDQLDNRLGLVSGRLERPVNLENSHIS